MCPFAQTFVTICQYAMSCYYSETNPIYVTFKCHNNHEELAISFEIISHVIYHSGNKDKSKVNIASYIL